MKFLERTATKVTKALSVSSRLRSRNHTTVEPFMGRLDNVGGIGTGPLSIVPGPGASGVAQSQSESSSPLDSGSEELSNHTFLSETDGPTSLPSQVDEQLSRNFREQADHTMKIFFEAAPKKCDGIDSESHAKIDGSTIVPCPERELGVDSDNLEFWTELSRGDDGGIVNGKLYTKLHCMIAALEIKSRVHAPTTPGIWLTLGKKFSRTLSRPDETVEINKIIYTTSTFYEKELGFNIRNSECWYLLGQQGGGQVLNKKYSEKDCYVRAVEMDPNNMNAWHSVLSIFESESESVVPGEWFNLGQLAKLLKDESVPNRLQTNLQNYTPSTFYEKELEVDPTNSECWTLLGEEGGGEVDGTSYSEKDCYSRAQTTRALANSSSFEDPSTN